MKAHKENLIVIYNRRTTTGIYDNTETYKAYLSMF